MLSTFPTLSPLLPSLANLDTVFYPCFTDGETKEQLKTLLISKREVVHGAMSVVLSEN